MSAREALELLECLVGLPMLLGWSLTIRSVLSHTENPLLVGLMLLTGTPSIFLFPPVCWLLWRERLPALLVYGPCLFWLVVYYFCA